MKIANASFVVATQHKAVQQYQRQESIDIEPPRPATANRPSQQAASAEVSDPEKTQLEADLSVLISIIEQILGRKFHFDQPDFADKMNDVEGLQFTPVSAEMNFNGAAITYNLSQTYYEQEQFNLNLSGEVKLEGGQTLDIDFSLMMNREFLHHQAMQIQNGQERKDPLVINFSVSHASFNQDRMTFDIDADGQLDDIATLAPGSGYLALDLNQDGVINDGRELFGPKTNQGFAELQQYDEDNNGWIDENDTVFDKLTVLSFDPDGKQVLSSIREKGVGAIFLGAINSPFSVKNNQNQDLAQIKHSSIVLMENGQATSIQEVDLFT